MDLGFFPITAAEKPVHLNQLPETSMKETLFDRFCMKCLAIPSKIILKNIWLGNIFGIENVPKKGPVILISNHFSYFDFLILGVLFEGILDRRLHFFAKQKVVDHPLFKYYAKYFQPLVISENKPINRVWKMALDLLKHDQVIGIFPEGTRSRSGELMPFKPGYLRLANATLAPILPVYLTNTYNILPPNKKLPRLEKSHVIIHKAINFDKKQSKEGLRTLNREIMNIYSSYEHRNASTEKQMPNCHIARHGYH
jgi:1-acyl-sn-glycerol-3-phosphate acyltransferase